MLSVVVLTYISTASDASLVLVVWKNICSLSPIVVIINTVCNQYLVCLLVSDF